jgi:hypothetical protein
MWWGNFKAGRLQFYGSWVIEAVRYFVGVRHTEKDRKAVQVVPPPEATVSALNSTLLDLVH